MNLGHIHVTLISFEVFPEANCGFEGQFLLYLKGWKNTVTMDLDQSQCTNNILFEKSGKKNLCGMNRI